MDSTMARTKKYLSYFSKSFFNDKVAISFLILIILTSIAIIAVLFMPAKDSKKSYYLTNSFFLQKE